MQLGAWVIRPSSTIRTASANGTSRLAITSDPSLRASVRDRPRARKRATGQRTIDVSRSIRPRSVHSSATKPSSSSTSRRAASRGSSPSSTPPQATSTLSRPRM